MFLSHFKCDIFITLLFLLLPLCILFLNSYPTLLGSMEGLHGNWLFSFIDYEERREKRWRIMASVPMLSLYKHIFLLWASFGTPLGAVLMTGTASVCMWKGLWIRPVWWMGQATPWSGAQEWPAMFLSAICFFVLFYHVRALCLCYYLLEFKWNSLNGQMIQEWFLSSLQI